MRKCLVLMGTLLLLAGAGCARAAARKVESPKMVAKTGMEVATLGGGCFWCLDSVYRQLKGVESVESGFAGGTVPNPTYQQVCTGTTGHAEVVNITFDPKIITYRDLLEVFWLVHDPTTLNRQGNDVGTQYRSAIFYHGAGQQKIAEASKAEAQKAFSDPIVTQIVPFTAFYEAEGYHQDYYENNRNQPYCRFVISPKLAKFRHHFQKWLKH